MTLSGITRHYRVYHSKLTHFIGICDPVYDTVIIHIWGHNDLGVMQESPHLVRDSQIGEACAL